jgi:hypothetical protein
LACAGNPPPQASVYHPTRYASLSNADLERQHAHLMREIDGYSHTGPSGNGLMGSTGTADSHTKYAARARAQDMERELMHRDPSGHLLNQSNALLANPR